ncbi:MAG TPA: hypothetical protein VJ835_03240, partial [Fimbriimonadaceae bacterium]|nr:hypothetical protein [Fimbriimonadaceae bacterium]
MNILLSLVCASIVGHVDDLDKVVSAEVRAASAPVAIAELSRQVGYPLEAMQSTKNDILVIKVDKVPLGQLMKRIGETINAGWEKTDRGYRLLRTAVMERDEEAAEQKVLAAQIDESLKKMRAKLEKDGEFTQQNAQRIADRWMAISRRNGNSPMSMDNWREEQALRNCSPSNRLIARMSGNLNAEMLASIPRNRRVVFSTQPNRMQRPMPVNLQPYIGTFLKEQTNWAKAMKFARSRSADPNYFYFEGINDPTGKKPGKILLSVARQNQGVAINLRIIIADTKGQPLGSATETLGWDGFQYNDQMAAAQKAGESEETMKFSGTSRELLDATTRMYVNGQGTPQLSQETRNLILNP